jgi:hypothetical protein
MVDTRRRDRLVAALVLLRDQLAPVVDELLADELSRDDQRQLANALRKVADELDSVVEAPEPGITPP